MDDMLLADLEMACDEKDLETAIYILASLEGSESYEEAGDMIHEAFPEQY